MGCGNGKCGHDSKFLSEEQLILGATANKHPSPRSVLVNVWNYSTWPAYKSRLWNKEVEHDGQRHGHTHEHGKEEHKKAR